MFNALRDDALTTTATGLELRIGLPWIRSMPLACVRELELSVDGVPVSELSVELAGRRRSPAELLNEHGWWFSQDRLVLAAPRSLEPGEHDVEVSFRLLVPYLMAGPGGGPLELPQRLARRLTANHPRVASVSLDVA